MKKIGVLLSGCGFLDGAEIRESVFTLLSIDQLGAQAVCIAPDIDQHHTINHCLQEEQGNSRNVLHESARIARGKIQNIADTDIEGLDALILPGGFGVAKNFSTFAFEGGKGSVNPQIEGLIRSIHEKHKPIGGICIAPAVLAMIFGIEGMSCTIGNDPEIAKQIALTGAGHVSKNVDEIHHDVACNVVTTPAYMYSDARISEVQSGIHKLVEKVLELA